MPGATGHVFVNAVDERSYLVMLCRRNGSLVRERLRAEICGGSWSAFNAALAATPVGNDGALGIYADMPEICPPQAPGVYRFLHGTPRPGPFASPATEVRALVEGQLLAMRVHGERCGRARGCASVRARVQSFIGPCPSVVPRCCMEMQRWRGMGRSHARGGGAALVSSRRGCL